jgi:hypothetical protein
MICLGLQYSSRELSRNTGKRGYRHKQANRLADERHQEIFYYRINPATQAITEPTQRYNKGTIMDMLTSPEYQRHVFGILG